MTGPIERALARASQSQNGQGHAYTTTTPDSSQNDTTIAQPVSDTSLCGKNRRKVHVNKLSERYNATKWMMETAASDGPKHIVSKCVKQFPSYFPGNMKANLEKASRWWKVRENTMLLKVDKKRLGSFSLSSTRKRIRLSRKAVQGRGPKRAPWVVALENDLVQEFERLRSAGVRFSARLLLEEAHSLIRDSDANALYHPSVVVYGKPLMEKVTARWIKHFMSRNKIVLRCQTGKLLVSPQKLLFIEKTVAFHLGVLYRGFTNGTFCEDTIENADETHFVFNMDSGKTLGFIGDNHVKYADVVSGGDPMTMMVRISGGVNAMIHPPMIIFKNGNRSYPIRGIPDNVPGVCYRSSPKGWMDSTVWKEWLSEPRAIRNMDGENSRALFVDNCSSHGCNDDVEVALQRINTKLYKLPANATDLVQPADSFVIQKIKEVWRQKWDSYKLQCVKIGAWKDGGKCNGSGRLVNPGKRFFLQLASDAVRTVNRMKDSKGISYARKAMVMTGMSLGYDGVWSESQLTQDLQVIVAKHRNHFEGEPVSAEDVKTESDFDD